MTSNSPKSPIEIIETGSGGNATLFMGQMLIDCGVPFKELKPYLRNVRYVFLTHAHSDHFKASTVRRIIERYPLVRFICPPWLSPLVKQMGCTRITELKPDIEYDCGGFRAKAVTLTHDVPNCGWMLFVGSTSLFYATDTANLNGIEAKNFNYYLLEANYKEAEITEKIAEKKENLEYAYERRVLETHLSEEACNEFFYQNGSENSVLIFMHQHKEKENTENE